MWMREKRVHPWFDVLHSQKIYFHFQLLLIKDCWAEDPAARPNTDQVRALVKSINHGRSANLMDHVFNVLEQYASNLEEEVESRMNELIEEKKKSDILLYRMLPRYAFMRSKRVKIMWASGKLLRN